MTVAPIRNDQPYRLVNARAPACVIEGVCLPIDEQGLCTLDLTIVAGKIESIEAPGSRVTDNPDSRERHNTLVLPHFVDLHTHLDKTHISPRSANPDGTFIGAIESSDLDQKRHWTPQDLTRRMDFSIRTAIAHGTRALRTHLDSGPETKDLVWPVFAELRSRWQARIDLQAVSLTSLERVSDVDEFHDLTSLVAGHDGLLGAVVYFSPELPRHLRTLIDAAATHGLDLDLHVDETLDPGADSLPLIADAVMECQFPGRVTVGHCCSLASHADAQIERTLDRVASAGLAVVSLPMCNQYLQDRQPARTPRSRGVTLVHEMRARAIPVAFASDNTRDPFFAYGDQDMLEVLREATRIAHLDHPVDAWPASVNRVPADIMGLPQHGRIATGAAADLVLFNARDYSELYSRPQSDRIVLHNGQQVDTSLPDYRELD